MSGATVSMASVTATKKGNNAALSTSLKRKTPSNASKVLRHKRSRSWENDRDRRQTTTWKISQTVGGRIAEIDPIFSIDEDRLILTFEDALAIYGVENSLLVRTIHLTTSSPTEAMGYLVASCLSPSKPNHVWVASSRGWVWRVDWVSGHGSTALFRHVAGSGTISDMTVISPSRIGDVLLMADSRSIFAFEITKIHQSAAVPPSRVLTKFPGRVRLLRAHPGSMFLAAIVKDSRVAVGTPTARRPLSFKDINYTFYAFDAPDHVCCLDTQRGPRDLDIALGCGRGHILVYRQVISAIRALEGSRRGRPPQPLLYHWHHTAVRSVRWLDQFHVASGGSEAALVVRQLDRSKQQILPHLGAPITNMTVSPAGSSIALNLLDNTAIVLMTADINTPTTYVGGIQTLAVSERPQIDPISRIGHPESQVTPGPVPAALHPRYPSRICLVVESGPISISAGENLRPAPLIQLFDLEHFVPVSKQALTRTIATESNLTSSGHQILPPRITHLAFSHDGKWLASVDEWLPPARDHGLAYDLDYTIKQQRESYLRFWDADPQRDPRSGYQKPMPLVTLVDAPHSSQYPRKVFGLAADPSRARFASVGDDGVVRIWAPKPRINYGIAVKDKRGEPTVAWACKTIVDIGESHMTVHEKVEGDLPCEPERNGELCFSEDGSALFVTLGTQFMSPVHIIDPESGEIRANLDNMFSGKVCGMQLVRKYLVCVSEEVRVYDIVAGELRYALHLKARNVIIAVDRQSETFALSFTHQNSGQSGIVVFNPREYSPLLEIEVHRPIISLVSPADAPGFVAVDASAQVRTIEDDIEVRSLRVLQSLEAMGLDEAKIVGHRPVDKDENMEGVMNDTSDEGKGSLSLAALADEKEDEDDEMDDRPGPLPITQDELATIFNQAPPWAIPSAEEIFNQVVALVGNHQRQAQTD